MQYHAVTKLRAKSLLVITGICVFSMFYTIQAICSNSSAVVICRTKKAVKIDIVSHSAGCDRCRKPLQHDAGSEGLWHPCFAVWGFMPLDLLTMDSEDSDVLPLSLHGSAFHK